MTTLGDRCSCMAELTETDSLCPVCLDRIPARRVRDGADVYLVKTCARHGEYKTILWRGEPDFASWFKTKPPVGPEVTHSVRDKGCPLDCGLCPEHEQRSCCVLLEVTSRCDLGCTICFASAGEPIGPDPSLEAMERWYRLLQESVGNCNIQLSGGEPTLRDDLPQIIALARAMGFSFVQLNTNGLRLASDPEYAETIRGAGLSTVFLQFDGLDNEIYQALRGAPLLESKKKAIANCARAGLGVVLVPTLVPGVNTAQVGRIVEYAMNHLPQIRGVHFQPISYFGRYPQAPRDSDRYTLPELMRDIEEQTGKAISVDDFSPSGCEHSLCGFHGDFVLMPDGSTRSLAGRARSSSCCERREPTTAVEKKRSHVVRHWSPCADSKAGCDSTAGNLTAGQGSTAGPMAEWDYFLDRVHSHGLTISAMAFQDAWNIDLQRLRSCCLHVVSPRGTIVPFCSYNLTDCSGRPLHRPLAARRTPAHAGATAGPPNSADRPLHRSAAARLAPAEAGASAAAQR